MNDIATLIDRFGFNVVMLLLAAYFIKYMFDKFMSLLDEEKLAHKESAPDFGARPYDEGVARTGATTVGARDFLIAVNFNLNTTSTRRANAIAFDVREKGRPVREGNPITGKIVKDAEGNPVM